MIKKTKRYVAMFAATTMLFGSFSNVQAAKKTYNDPYSLAQDYLDFTGVSTVVGEKHTKTEKVKVAINDGGFQLDQEDLADMWVQDKTKLDKIVGTDNKYGHGTICSSMISAKSDNGKGVAGISNDIEIYPLSFYAKPDSYNFWNLESAIQYCMDKNIRILSCSFACTEENTELVEALKEYDDWGGLVVCSAGNAGLDNDRKDNSGVDNNGNKIAADAGLDDHIGKFARKYGVSNIIEVTSTRDKEYSTWASYGKVETNIGAPGEFVLVPNNMYFDNGVQKEDELPYGPNGGTSLATPYVAGVCALLKSYYPSASMKQIKTAVLNGAEKRASLKDRCSSGGMINAQGALKELQKMIGCAVEEGEYYIKNRRTGNYLTTSSTGNGVNVSTSSYTGSNYQKWKVEYTKQGHYIILPVVNESRSLDVYNKDYTTVGTNVQQYDYSEAINQRWVLSKTRTNTYKILSAGHNQYAVNAATSATRGSTTVSKQTLAIAAADNADEWVFEKIDDLYEGQYYVNIGNQYMKYSSSSAGASLTGADFQQGANQKWTFKYRGNDIYSIHPNGNTSVALELQSGNSSDETIPALATYSSTSSRQRWQILSKSDWTKRIYSTMTSTKCLTLDADSKISNSLQSSSNTKQQIKLEAVDSIYNGTYFMKNSLKNLYASAKNSSSAQYVDMNSTTQTTNQKWNFQYHGNGQYSITPYVNSNLRLDAYNGETHDNWAVWQYSDNGTPAQRWGISENEDETVTIYSRVNSNYALNYNESGNTTSYNNARFSLKIRDSRELSERWVLEKATYGTNLDGKTIKYTNGTSTIDYSRLIYVGNNMYVLQKDGQNLELNRKKVTQVYNEKTKTVSREEAIVNINCSYSFKTPDYSNINQQFMVKKLGSYYYICPADIRNSGLTSDGTNTWLNKTNTKQRFSVS